MAFRIEDGKGRGYISEVNKDLQLQVESKNDHIQHFTSIKKGQAYQVIGDDTTVTNATQTILHLTNDSSTHYMVVTYIRCSAMDLAGGTAIPNASTRFELGFGRSYSSGGTEVTPVNMNKTSGNVAEATAYDNSPTLSGTFVEADRFYPSSDGEEQTYNKEGSIILGKNDTFEIRLVTDHTSGTAYARVTFIMVER